MKTLNELYSSLSARRRYEVWFVRFGLADGSGAWWFRYLLTNPGRHGCAATNGDNQHDRLKPAQIWATWFPAGASPQTFICGFDMDRVELSDRGSSPFHFHIGSNGIDESSCKGALEADGHHVSWNLHYRSTFRTTMSDKGWIGFSRTPHSNALFSGQVTLDDRVFQGNPLGCGLQGHNCGYRHRGFWTWAHVYFVRADGSSSSFEALTYDMPLGMKFRKAVLWHESRKIIFRDLHEIRRDQETLAWELDCSTRDGLRVHLDIDGAGRSKHVLAYMKTDCSGNFEVLNNSFAKARILLDRPAGAVETYTTTTGAVLEMVGHD